MTQQDIERAKQHLENTMAEFKDCEGWDAIEEATRLALQEAFEHGVDAMGEAVKEAEGNKYDHLVAHVQCPF